jgi:hypothetical protein
MARAVVIHVEQMFAHRVPALQRIVPAALLPIQAAAWASAYIIISHVKTASGVLLTIARQDLHPAVGRKLAIAISTTPTTTA